MRSVLGLVLCLFCVSVAQADGFAVASSRSTHGYHSHGLHAVKSSAVSYSSSGSYGSRQVKRLENRVHRLATKLAVSASHGG